MTNSTVESLRQHNADYGIDGSFHTVSARAQELILGAASAILFGCAGVSLARGKSVIAVLASAVNALILTTVAFYLHTTRRGKFDVWAQILDELKLHGDENLLDLGCGRGAVLLAAAKLLPRGRAVGIDLWRPDQTGNSPEATLSNAALENVADRVELRTADISDLPFDDNSVDVVVSSLVIHNITNSAGRRQAIKEAARVLRAGGRLAIVDLGFTRQYVKQLHELGLQDVLRRGLGWRMWWGGPWFPTHLVTATKPPSNL